MLKVLEGTDLKPADAIEPARQYLAGMDQALLGLNLDVLANEGADGLPQLIQLRDRTRKARDKVAAEVQRLEKALNDGN